MSKKTLIVIGNGMVGHHFLEQFCASPAAADFEIIVFGEEKQLAYDMCENIGAPDWQKACREWIGRRL